MLRFDLSTVTVGLVDSLNSVHVSIFEEDGDGIFVECGGGCSCGVAFFVLPVRRGGSLYICVVRVDLGLFVRV